MNSSKLDDTVTVEITIWERVQFSRLIEMKRSDFSELSEKLQTLNGKELRRHEEKIGSMLDRHSDYRDSDELEIEVFEIVEQ